MLYAKVVLGLPVEGPFDYIVPETLGKKIKIGSRVWVDFGRRRLVGYVVGLSAKTNIKRLKSISELIDVTPLLNKETLLLARELSEYYCCSWGQAVETTIPESLRRGRRTPDILIQQQKAKKDKGSSRITLVHDLDGSARWDIYLKQIKEALDNNTAAIILLPSIRSVLKAKTIIIGALNIEPALLHRKQPREMEEWLKIKEGRAKIILGTRSAVFAPVPDLGLLIIDDEQDAVYKQDQVPHYHARQAAFMRVNIEEKAELILGSSSPSLEAFYLAQKGKIRYMPVAQKKASPEIKIIDTRYSPRMFLGKRPILSKIAGDAIFSALSAKGKVLLFLNRKGFATSASCLNCGTILKCPRCDINLVYHFKENILNCHYCNFKMPACALCPNCNASYIQYKGTGTEKIESELSRSFPLARIKRIDRQEQIDSREADIFISTQAVIHEANFKFNLIVVLGLDSSLNRVDFRSAEKVFALLTGLLGLSTEKMIVETHLVNHHCFRAMLARDAELFYTEELKHRKTLMFPPYKHMALVKLRSKNEERTKTLAQDLFNRLTKYGKKDKGIEIASVNPAHPDKLRGNFYWQILIKSAEAKKISRFLKIHLKNFAHSGIIVTVDVDPV